MSITYLMLSDIIRKVQRLSSNKAMKFLFCCKNQASLIGLFGFYFLAFVALAVAFRMARVLRSIAKEDGHFLFLTQFFIATQIKGKKKAKMSFCDEINVLRALNWFFALWKIYVWQKRESTTFFAIPYFTYMIGIEIETPKRQSHLKI